MSQIDKVRRWQERPLLYADAQGVRRLPWANIPSAQLKPRRPLNEKRHIWVREVVRLPAGSFLAADYIGKSSPLSVASTVQVLTCERFHVQLSRAKNAFGCEELTLRFQQYQPLLETGQCTREPNSHPK